MPTQTHLANMLNKVPAVTVAFWVAKTFATTVGETAADYLNTQFRLGLTTTSLIMAGLLAIACGLGADSCWTTRQS